MHIRTARRAPDRLRRVLRPAEQIDADAQPAPEFGCAHFAQTSADNLYRRMDQAPGVWALAAAATGAGTATLAAFLADFRGASFAADLAGDFAATFFAAFFRALFAAFFAGAGFVFFAALLAAAFFAARFAARFAFAQRALWAAAILSRASGLSGRLPPVVPAGLLPAARPPPVVPASNCLTCCNSDISASNSVTICLVSMNPPP